MSKMLAHRRTIFENLFEEYLWIFRPLPFDPLS
jgi:hypothetical protein